MSPGTSRIVGVGIGVRPSSGRERFAGRAQSRATVTGATATFSSLKEAMAKMT